MMICGAAKRAITPPEELLGNLNGLGNVVFSGVLDEIYVRALALGDGRETLLFMVFDLDKVPDPERYLSLLSARTGIPQSHISLLSIHTHTAPVTGWRPNEGPNFIRNKPEQVRKATREYEVLLERAAVEAAAEAAASMRPARIGWSRGESYVNINRVQDYVVRRKDGSSELHAGLGQDPAAWVDRGLFVLKAEDEDGKWIACLTNYAVHNCVMIGNRCGKDGGTLLSSDLGGNVCQMIEDDHPGCVALWTSGAAGDVNPVMSNEIFYPDPATGAQTAYLLPPGDTAPLMMLKVLAARHCADVLRALEQTVCTGETPEIGALVRWAEMPGAGEKPYRIRVHLMRIGDLGLWGVSGEMYSSLGRAVTQGLPDGVHCILNHDASLIANTGYIYDDETLLRDREGVLPGRRSSEMLPGYAKTVLTGVTADMWKRISEKGGIGNELSNQAEAE